MNIRVLRKLAWMALPLMTLCVSCGEDDDTSWKDQIAGLETDLTSVQDKVNANASSLATLKGQFEAGEWVTDVKFANGVLSVSTNKSENKSTLSIGAETPVVQTKVRVNADGTLSVGTCVDTGEYVWTDGIDLPSVDVPSYELKQVENEDGKLILKLVSSDGEESVVTFTPEDFQAEIDALQADIDELSADVSGRLENLESVTVSLGEEILKLSSKSDLGALQLVVDGLAAQYGEMAKFLKITDDFEKDALELLALDIANIVENMNALQDASETLTFGDVEEMINDIETTYAKSTEVETAIQTSAGAIKTAYEKAVSDAKTALEAKIKALSDFDALATSSFDFKFTADGFLAITSGEGEELIIDKKVNLFSALSPSFSVNEETNMLEMTIAGGQPVVIKSEDLFSVVGQYALIDSKATYYTIKIGDESIDLPTSPISMTDVELICKYVDVLGQPLEVIKSAALEYDPYQYVDGVKVYKTNGEGEEAVRVTNYLSTMDSAEYRVNPSALVLTEAEEKYLDPKYTVAMLETMSAVGDEEPPAAIVPQEHKYENGVLRVKYKISTPNAALLKTLLDDNGIVVTMNVGNPLYLNMGYDSGEGARIYTEQHGVQLSIYDEVQVVSTDADGTWDGSRKEDQEWPLEATTEYLEAMKKLDPDNFNDWKTVASADVLIPAGTEITLDDLVKLQVAETAITDKAVDCEKLGVTDCKWEFELVKSEDDPVKHFDLIEGEKVTKLKHYGKNSDVHNWINVKAKALDNDGYIIAEEEIMILSQQKIQGDIELETKVRKISDDLDLCSDAWVKVAEQDFHFVYDNEDVDLLPNDFEKQYELPTINLKNFKFNGHTVDGEMHRYYEGDTFLGYYLSGVLVQFNSGYSQDITTYEKYTIKVENGILSTVEGDEPATVEFSFKKKNYTHAVKFKEEITFDRPSIEDGALVRKDARWNGNMLRFNGTWIDGDGGLWKFDFENTVKSAYMDGEGRLQSCDNLDILLKFPKKTIPWEDLINVDDISELYDTEDLYGEEDFYEGYVNTYFFPRSYLDRDDAGQELVSRDRYIHQDAYNVKLIGVHIPSGETVYTEDVSFFFEDPIGAVDNSNADKVWNEGSDPVYDLSNSMMVEDREGNILLQKKTGTKNYYDSKMNNGEWAKKFLVTSDGNEISDWTKDIYSPATVVFDEDAMNYVIGTTADNNSVVEFEFAEDQIPEVRQMIEADDIQLFGSKVTYNPASSGNKGDYPVKLVAKLYHRYYATWGTLDKGFSITLRVD